MSEVEELKAEIERLRRWKDEALPVMDGLQELGRALDVPLGTRITGRVSLDAVLDLKNERNEARAAIDAAVAERLAEVLAPIERAWEGVGMSNAIHDAVAAHVTITETDPPNDVEPYIWCLCGWRSDIGGGITEAAGRTTQVHLTNVMHSAVRDHLRAALSTAKEASDG